MSSTLKYIANSFIWSSISKILNALLKFISIPLLLNYFGKESFGLITLAISINAYMQLLDMGMNTGAVKFFSQWIANKNYGLINRVTRTNLTVYSILGILNCIILLLIAWRGSSLFNITESEFSKFRYLLYILAGTSIINWTTFVFNQLLIAGEKIAFTQKILSIRNILNLCIVLLTLHFEWSLIKYFFIDSIISMLIIIPYYLKCKQKKLIKSILPGFFWKDFSIVFKYSLAIFAMSIFQFTATNSRPLILGMFSNTASSILADYRIVEVFPIFIISIGGMLISILLPKSSKAVEVNDYITINKIAYEGTKYTSILVSLLCFPIILSSNELLTLYVGDSYSHLSIWLSLWVFTLTLYLHNSPVSSLVLATGKTRMLVYSSAIACFVSIIINIILSKSLGVGSAVIGYFLYIGIQMSFYYFYFNNKVLHLNSLKIFKSFYIPTLIGLLLTILFFFIPLKFDSIVLCIIVKSILWLFLYVIIIITAKIVSIREVIGFVRK